MYASFGLKVLDFLAVLGGGGEKPVGA